MSDFSIFSTRKLTAILALCHFAWASAGDGCAPVTWQDDGLPKMAAMEKKPYVPPKDYFKRPPNAGEINCRMPSFPLDHVDDESCAELAYSEGMPLEKFFMLNPHLEKDCSNIETNTRYCIEGFIEPVRAHDGFCGPHHNNATCIGVPQGQCCNSEIWQCGDTADDCAMGTCYEGTCMGDKVYSTDGTCGKDFGWRLCWGKWGDCCNDDGKCGSGEGFCGEAVCQQGNFDLHQARPLDFKLPYDRGNTPDGSCGGDEGHICDFWYGGCCSKDNECGVSLDHCGEGCQPDFGMCRRKSDPTKFFRN